MEDLSFDDLVNSCTKKTPPSEGAKLGAGGRWAMAITQPKQTSPSPLRKRPLATLLDPTNASSAVSATKEMRSSHFAGVDVSSGALSGGCGTRQRIGHVIAIIDGNIYIHGGETITAASAMSTLGELIVYTSKRVGAGDGDGALSKLTLSTIMTEGPTRAWHTCNVLTNGLLLVWGGEVTEEPNQKEIDGVTLGMGKEVVHERKTTYIDEPILLDPKINMWYPPAISGTGPGPRSGHTSAIVRGDLIVYICGRKGGSYCSSIFYLDTTRMHWMRPLIDGKPPRGRVHHTSSTIDNNTIVTFGGNDSYRCFNDVFCLECNDKGLEWKWYQPEVKGDIPPPRTGHIAVVIKEGCILVFNGYDPYYYDGDPTGVYDSKFDASVGCEHDNEERSALFYPDFYVLDCREWKWTKVTPSACHFAKVDDSPSGDGGMSRLMDQQQQDQQCMMSSAFSSAVLLEEPDNHNDMYTILISGGLNDVGQYSKYFYTLRLRFDIFS